MDATAKMALFQNLFYVSAAIAAIGLGFALFTFFYFDIRNVYALMTGKARRQTIERMAEQNSRTGRLQAISENIRDPNVPRIQHPSQVVTAEMQYTEQIKPSQVEMETSILADSSETTILTDNSETTVLRQEPQQEETDAAAGETTILTPPANVQSDIRFDITESTMVIHTDEIL